MEEPLELGQAQMPGKKSMPRPSDDRHSHPNQENKGEDPTAHPASLPYITTSDILNRMNSEFQRMGAADGDLQTPAVELQRRLPDGSTRRCNEDELRASDLQTKLQQTAKLIQELNEQEKIEWAKDQRLVGNSLFQSGEYAQAMDIYLTCLVVKNNSDEFLMGTFLPVLSNLAQCTLKLSMYKKTIQFCNLCFEELEPKDHLRKDLHIPLSKMHYKRGKAHRLSGEYKAARKDLDQGMKLLETLKETRHSSVIDYEKAIQNEIRNLEMAEREGRRNLNRTKKAMQTILNSGGGRTSDTNTIQSPTETRALSSTEGVSGTNLSASEGLYEQNPTGTKRRYSTLRAPKRNPRTNQAPNQSQTDKTISYSRYYWDMVARVCETLLIWLGDEETIANCTRQELEAPCEDGKQKGH